MIASRELTIVCIVVCALNRTFYPKEGSFSNDWYLIDASEVVVGRLASTVAKIVSGKLKSIYNASVDCGDNVIIVNSSKAVFTGKKYKQKVYYRHTGFPGGIKSDKCDFLFEKGKSERVLKHAIKGMLRKGSSLARRQLNRVYIYSGSEHNNAAQKPKAIKLSALGYEVISG